MGFFDKEEYNIDTICLNCGEMEIYYNIEKVGVPLKIEKLKNIKCKNCSCKGFLIVKGNSRDDSDTTMLAAGTIAATTIINS